MIYPNGKVVNLLDLDYVGFHAGDYPVNVRSIAVALVGDLTTAEPTVAAQAALKELLLKLKQEKGIKYLEGHRDVRQNHTVCPGEWFAVFRQNADLSDFQSLPKSKKTE